MDVDDGDTEPEGKGDEGEDEEAQMSVDGEGAPPRRRKKSKSSKLKPRRSQIDVVAMNNEQAALAALESNAHEKLRLRKKYYTEALAFIREIESSMDIMCQLLASTSKPEVQEAIEFFRVTYEYKFESAKVSARREGCQMFLAVC